MVKNKSKLIAILAILFFLFSFTFSYADDVATENAVESNTSGETTNSETSENTITDSQTQNDSYKKKDVYLSGDNVTIDYIVDGNVFICANTVNINSQIGGDAFIFAKNITIGEKGYVFSNLFACTESLEIKGVVYDVYSVAKEININGGYIYRDLKSACQTLNINGTIGRNVFVNCSNINFNTDQKNNGVIYGNLEYTADSKLDIPERNVSGVIKYNENEENSSKNDFKEAIIILLNFIIFVLAIWLICLWIAPKFINNTDKYTGKKSLSTFGYGLLGLIVVPIISLIFFLVVLTAKVGAILLGLYILLLFISTAISIIAINNCIDKKLKITNKYAMCGMLALCSLVIGLLNLVPYLNIVIEIILTSFGFGILIDTIIPKKNK